MRSQTLFASFILIFSCGVALADGRKFDPADGTDPRQYPPDRQVDYTHVKLDLRMPDPMSRSFTCTETIGFRTLGLPIAVLKLDAVGLDIKSVSDGNGKPLTFSTDDEHLMVQFAPELAPRTEGTLVIEYTCTKPTDGMIFALPDEAYPDRPLMVHTQGQTETNRHWFICHDYPNERCTSEIVATVPAKYKVLANGGLVQTKPADHGMVRWHYKLSKPHVSYLVSLVVGEFDVVSDKWRDIPVEYWVPPGQQSGAMRTFGKTPKMLDLFSRLTGADYPYEKYAQAVVYLFNAGGMENTSTTTLQEMCVMDERAAVDQDLEGLISHELAHQWFGDMITCKSWAHIWLNEGFATYFSHLWDEYEHGRDEYDDGMWRTMREVADASQPDASGGMVWFYYDTAWETFRRRGNNAYSKGASVLHMLRQSLGDELFFKCIAEYVKRSAWQDAESDDLRKVIEDLSGRSYERFFQQWVYRSGAPRVQVTYGWDPQTKSATVTLEQKQEINEICPAFAAELAVWLVDGSGGVTRRTVEMEGRRSSAAFPCESEPTQVVIDPGCAVLMDLQLDLPLAMLIAQASHGPTTLARLNAIAALSKRDEDAARKALREILLDEKLFYGMRNEAAASLGRMQTDSARDILCVALGNGNPIANPKTRRAAAAALGQYRGAQVTETLLRFAKSDPGYAVEAEASKSLGHQEPTDEVIQVLLVNANKSSWRDQIRTAAIEALGQLGDPRGIKPATELASYGQPFRSRSTGIEALAKLGREDEPSRDEIRMFLITLLHDPQERASRAAISALGELRDEKAIPDLEKLANSSAPKDQRDRARAAIDTIRKGGGESETVRGLRERVEALEKDRDKRHRGDAGESKPAPATAPAG